MRWWLLIAALAAAAAGWWFGQALPTPLHQKLTVVCWIAAAIAGGFFALSFGPITALVYSGLMVFILNRLAGFALAERMGNLFDGLAVLSWRL